MYNFFGLDNATMRLGFDYGITNNVMIGVGHSTYQKTYDAFFKAKVLRQSKGQVSMPVTIALVAAVALNSLHAADFYAKPDSGVAVKRASYVLQALIEESFLKIFRCR